METRTKLVQTLVLNQLDEVLLVRWTEGCLANKYTGCLAEAEEGDKTEEENAAAVVKRLVGLDLNPERMERVASFEFLEVDGEDCDEVEFIYRTTRAESTQGRADSGGVSARWFKFDDIPYAEMPADDLLWYPLVLQAGRVLSGSFTFDDDILLEHEIRDASDGSVLSRQSRDPSIVL